MNGLALVREVQVAGGRLTLVHGTVKITAPAPLPHDLIERLRAAKPQLVAVLSASGPDWNADDWRAFFNERAAIAEHDGGLSRPEAEARAYECSVAHWCNLIPPPATTGDDCPVCGNPLGETAIPVLRPGGGHLWLHSACVQPFNIHRRDEARRALAEAGIAAPSSTSVKRK